MLQHKTSGFSLAVLLVAIAIIGILSVRSDVGAGGVQGALYFNTTLNFMRQLPESFLRSPGFRMGLWNNGDNDGGDCVNSAIDFIINVEYVK